MTWRLLTFTAILFAACGEPQPSAPARAAETRDDTGSIVQSGSNAAIAAPAPEVPLVPLPPPKPTRRPQGIYQALLPTDGGKVEQTVQFFANGHFDLQERYLDRGDSIVRVAGLWAPSDGQIWLYENEVVRGRYAWIGDTLAYQGVNPKKSTAMLPLQDAETTQAWKNRRAEGLKVFAVGTEPFWSASLTAADSLEFQLADWKMPISLKLDSSSVSGGSRIYLASRDSVRLRLQVEPYFCSDGMSDLHYRQRVRVQYNAQSFSGCGAVFK